MTYATTKSKQRVRTGRAKTFQGYSEEIALPSSPNTPPANLTDYTWFIYGEKNIGKSTLASQFPDVTAHMMWETNRRGLKTRMIPDPSRREKPLDWSRFQEYLSVLLAEHEPGRIVIDTLDLCARAWEDHHAKIRGVSTLLGIQDHGRTWATCMDNWINTFAALFYAGWRFTFISHVRRRPRVIRGVSREEAKELAEEGVIASETQPSARPWSVGWAKESVAYAGYYGWWGEERIFQIRGSGSVFAACENSEDHFLQPPKHAKKGTPYHLIQMGHSPSDAFHNLTLAWGNKLEGYYAEQTED